MKRRSARVMLVSVFRLFFLREYFFASSLAADVRDIRVFLIIQKDCSLIASPAPTLTLVRGESESIVFPAASSRRRRRSFAGKVICKE